MIDNQEMYSKLLIENSIDKDYVYNIKNNSEKDIKSIFGEIVDNIKKDIENMDIPAKEKEYKNKILAKNIKKILIYDYIIESEKKCLDNDIGIMEYMKTERNKLKKAIIRANIIDFICIIVIFMIILFLNIFKCNYSNELIVKLLVYLLIGPIFVFLYIPNNILKSKFKARLNLTNEAIETE